MAHKKRSPELVALAVQLYEETRSTLKVARRLELATSVVYRMLIGAGVHLPARHSQEVQNVKKKLHGDQAKQAAEDYAGGMHLSEIRKKYGVGTWAIRTAVKDQGGELRSRGGRWKQFSEETKAEIVRLYTVEKWSQAHIAVKFNSSPSMIGRLLLDLKVTKRVALGDTHSSWNGGRMKIGGYEAVMVDREDPMYVMAHHTGYVLEHRLVMARYLGRPLVDNETVHHVNGDKADNRIENLQLRFGRHGKGVALCCRQCGSFDIEMVEL